MGKIGVGHRTLPSAGAAARLFVAKFPERLHGIMVDSYHVLLRGAVTEGYRDGIAVGVGGLAVDAGRFVATDHIEDPARVHDTFDVAVKDMITL